MSPALHLHRVQTPPTAIGSQFSGVHLWDFKNHRELVGGTPVLKILLKYRQHISLQAPGLSLIAKGYRVDPQLLGDHSYALAMGLNHPPSHINLYGFALTTDQLAPSGTQIVEVVGMEKRYLCWQREGAC